jgi:hypothetical protein
MNNPFPLIVDAKKQPAKSEIRTPRNIKTHASSSILREYVLVRNCATFRPITRFSLLIINKLDPLGTLHACMPIESFVLTKYFTGHTQLTHFSFMLPPFCRLRLCLWGSAHINYNLDGSSGLERLRTGGKSIFQSSEVSQDNKTIGLMGQASYQAVSGNPSRKREGLVLSAKYLFDSLTNWLSKTNPCAVLKPSIKGR